MLPRVCSRSRSLLRLEAPHAATPNNPHALCRRSWSSRFRERGCRACKQGAAGAIFLISFWRLGLLAGVLGGTVRHRPGSATSVSVILRFYCNSMSSDAPGSPSLAAHCYRHAVVHRCASFCTDQNWGVVVCHLSVSGYLGTLSVSRLASAAMFLPPPLMSMLARACHAAMQCALPLPPWLLAGGHTLTFAIFRAFDGPRSSVCVFFSPFPSWLSRHLPLRLGPGFWLVSCMWGVGFGLEWSLPCATQRHCICGMPIPTTPCPRVVCSGGTFHCLPYCCSRQCRQPLRQSLAPPVRFHIRDIVSGRAAICTDAAPHQAQPPSASGF